MVPRIDKGSNTLGLLAAFFSVVRPPLFGLGRGPITPPGPAMVLMDQKDLNSKNKQTNKGSSQTSTGPCQADIRSPQADKWSSQANTEPPQADGGPSQANTEPSEANAMSSQANGVLGRKMIPSGLQRTTKHALLRSTRGLSNRQMTLSGHVKSNMIH